MTWIWTCVFQVEYDKEQKGAVSAIEGVQGFLVTAIGQKVSLLMLPNVKLIRVQDASLYLMQHDAV